MRDRVTFCIKTIHRPHCCATLVRSIYETCGEHRPLIHVLDDGRPDLRFSKCCTEEAAMVDRLVETEYDIGLSAGRNRLLDLGDSPVVIFTDDDHVITEKTRLAELVQKLDRYPDLDLLSGMSNTDEGPRMLHVKDGVLHIQPGELRRHQAIARCHYVGNCFAAYRDVLQAIRWDEDLKVEEHWDFFWRAKLAGMKVGVATDHVFKHVHVDPPGYVRKRPEFLTLGLQKHGLRKVMWK
jgi:GT2 family glycosyltransferase